MLLRRSDATTPPAAGRSSRSRRAACGRECGCLAPRAAAALASAALAAVTKGFSGADLAGLTRSTTLFALERYVDDALLDGWQPGAAKPQAAGGTDADVAEGLLEVGYEDLVFWCGRCASPRRSRRTRAVPRWSEARGHSSRAASARSGGG